MADEVLRFDIIAQDRASSGFTAAGRSASEAAGNVDKLSRRLEEVSRRSATARLRLDGDKAALAELDRTDAKLLGLDRRVASPRLKVEGAARALADISAVDAALDKLGRKDQKAGGGFLQGLADKAQAHGGPSFLGPALMLAPAAAAIGGVGLGAAAGLAGAFTAAAGAAGAFGAVAKPVLSDAQKASQGVQAAQEADAAAVAKVTAQYGYAMSAATTKAQRQAAYAAEQKGFSNAEIAQNAAVAKSYAGMSPAQIALSKQLGAMSQAWKDLKTAQTPVVAGALQPWLKSVTDLTKNLAPVIAKVSPVIHDLGARFDELIRSSSFTAFRDFIASTGSASVSATGSALTGFFKGFMILLPQFDPLIREAVGWISRLGPAFVTWASSQKTADRIQGFMQWFSRNGPVVGEMLRNIGGALKALAPGLAAGATEELKIISGFFGLVARLPPALARPLAEVAGALLLLNKLGVVKAGVQFTGWTFAKGGAAGGEATAGAAGAEGAVAGGLMSRLTPGLKWAVKGGILIAGAKIGLTIAASEAPRAALPDVRHFQQSTPGGVKKFLDFFFGSDVNSASVAAYLKKLFGPAANWGPQQVFDWLRHAVANVFDGIRHDVTHYWEMTWRYVVGSLDQARHQVAHTADNLAAYLTGSFSKTGAQIAHAWNVTWDNTISRAARGFHDLAGWFDRGRHDTAATLSGIRADAANWWNSIWNNTISRTARGFHDVAGWFDTGRRQVASSLAQTRAGAAIAWDAIWNNTVGRTVRGVRDTMSWVGTLPGRITGTFKDAGTWLVASGWNALTGFWNGLKAVWVSVSGWFAGLPHQILHALGIASPPPWAIDAGKHIMGGLLKGIAHGAGDVKGFFRGIAMDVTGPFKGIWGGLASAGKDVWHFLFGGGRVGSSQVPNVGSGIARWAPLVQQALAMEHLNPGYVLDVLYQMLTESGGNPNAINLCVPLETVILTRRGWLKHSDVQPGDETVGYNPATGCSEWTRVTAVHHYDDAPLVRLGNSRWHATTTPQHKWVNLPRVTMPAEPVADSCHLCDWPEGTRRRGKTTRGGLRIHLAKAHGMPGAPRPSAHAAEPQWVRTEDIRSRDRLLLAAPAETGAGLPVTVTEAAILGWIAGDGHVERGRRGASISIAQTKPLMVAKLRDLLADVSHAEYVTNAKRGARAFRLSPSCSRDLLERAGHPKQDAVRQVLAMSRAQREAWLEAIIDAEGHRSVRPGYSEPQVSISQTLGPVHDAIVLAVYLTGHRPRVLAHTRNHERWSDSNSIHPNNPVITGAFLKREDAGRGPVWCVTTELGTWTAEEDGHVFLTGNSDVNAQRGDPSKGLMQVIGGTFAAYHWPGTSWNIYDPLANIAAALNYAAHGRGFGSGPGQIGSGHGYALGTSGAAPGWAWVGERGPELMRFRGGEQVAPVARRARGGDGAQTVTYIVKVDPALAAVTPDRRLGQHIAEHVLRHTGAGGRLYPPGMTPR